MTVNLSHIGAAVTHLSDSWQNNFLHQICQNGKSSVAGDGCTCLCTEQYRVTRRRLIIWASLGPWKQIICPADTIEQTSLQKTECSDFSYKMCAL